MLFIDGTAIDPQRQVSQIDARGSSPVAVRDGFFLRIYAARSESLQQITEANEDRIDSASDRSLFVAATALTSTAMARLPPTRST